MSAFVRFRALLIAAALGSAAAAVGLVAYYGSRANAQGGTQSIAKGGVPGGGEATAKAASAGKSPGGQGAGQAPVPVTVAEVAQRAVPFRVQAVGSVEPYATVAVKAQVDGQIVETHFREGQAVRAGSVLFSIDPRPFEAALRQAEANHQRDRAQLAQAERQEARYQELLAKNFVSKEAYAQFKTGSETAAAAVLASRAALENARLQLEYTTIRTPIDGYAGRIQIQKGNLVKANDTMPLVVLNQVHPIYVSFSVPEQDLPAVRKYLAAGPLAVEATPPNADAPATGKLVFVDNAVDASTGTIKLKGLFENRGNGLWPGQYVNVSLKLYDQKDALTVPSRAVQTGPSGQYVFVVKPDMSVEVRPVSVQRSEGDLAIIETGLARAEQVVTQGQLRLAPGTRVVVKGAVGQS